MEVEFRYKDLINRCEQLSSFESEGKFDAAGQSRYLEIHINEVDKIIIRQYIDEARAILEERLDRMITDTEDINVYTFDRIMGENSPGYAVWYIKPDSERPEDAVIVFLKSAGIDTENGPAATELTDFYRFVYCDINMFSRYIYLSTPAWYSDMNALFLNLQDGKYYKLRPREGTGYELVETPGDVCFRWTLRTDTRWKENPSFAKHVSEAIVAYTMSAWLSDKLPDRVAFYDALFTASTEMAVKNIFKKQVPRYEE